MFNHLLVPLDESSDAEQALFRAVELAKLSGARLSLITVIAPLGPPDQDEVRQIEEASRQRGEQYLQRQAAEAREAGVTDVGYQAVNGIPADVILSTAQEQGADLIVMSSHGLGRADRFPLGSVALRVLMAAPDSVLVVRTSRGAPST